jgi:hypothetical protein
MHIEGYVLPGFEPVYAAFLNNFATFGEVVSSVCVYHRGVPVVDLAAGYSDQSRKPYRHHASARVLSVKRDCRNCCQHAGGPRHTGPR